MSVHSVSLLEKPYRVMFKSQVEVNLTDTRAVYREAAQPHWPVNVLFDTGCINTLFPYDLWLEGFARELKLTSKITVAGHKDVPVKGYVIDRLVVGKAVLPNVLGFSHPSFIEGEFLNLVMGANVFHRWRSTQDFRTRRFEFADETGSRQSYFRYFDDNGKLIMLSR